MVRWSFFLNTAMCTISAFFFSAFERSVSPMYTFSATRVTLYVPSR